MLSIIKEEKEQKPDIPQKSSMEILSELFSTFHAKPPVIVKKEKLVESNKRHKKKKKHKSKDKKHKKKEKKKKYSSSNSTSNDETDEKLDLAQILIKQEKELAEKKIKDEIDRVKRKSQDYEKSEEQSIKLEESDEEIMIQAETSRDSLKRNVTTNIKYKSLFDSAICDIKSNIDVHEEGEATDSDDSRTKKKKHKSHSKKRSRSRSREPKHIEKKLKVDEKSETKHRDKDKFRKHSRDNNKHRDRSRSSEHVGKSRDKEKNVYNGKSDRWSRENSREHDRERHRERHRSRERFRDEYSRDLEDYRKRRFNNDEDFHKKRDDRDSEEKWFMRDRYRGYSSRDRRRTPSNERDSKFDKKKLLEIARRNAITMMKSGSLPAALTLGPQAQEKVIAAIKSGGKTIEELTDFCKTLSKKEELGELSSLSEKEDSDSDADKPFHHPFQIKDRPTSITMNIKNSIPLPVKSALERTSELRIQFPVSSGQHHRKGEEWMPVSPPPEKKTDILPNASVTIPPVTNTISNTINIPLPLEQAPPSTKLASAPIKELAQAAVVPILPEQDPSTVPAPPNGPPGPQVFPSKIDQPTVDIGSIVSQRLSAMRKLQENPNDVQALTQIYKSNREMQSWATSKQQLGQFTGSTGAQILSQAELSSGYQAWTKKDQLQSAAPVSGGMGMHLLQKMGWKPGEGLGKDRTGALEPLLLEVKLDKKGLVANEEQKQNKKKQKVPGSIKNFQGKHPVSLLGEYASKKKLGAPQYILEFECGPDHKKNFLFKVVLNGVEYKPNVASNNKKEAKLAAATICLQQIGLLPPP
ncbi:protein Son isoform X1 [Diorhabda sublineata]|uniref:protein Son isoform X1 n=1 Tax=Diorhabda sublineata TaxID=1163346 RepID=UPI0024E13B19|nr:protein Son isoform X1 [Diorhabda sublineata]XP_056640315.1 protein Son isoform X1 [Diorhabda sublineata]